jgi:tripartite-type tricarboxylate transporter receptor subunit TctC
MKMLLRRAAVVAFFTCVAPLALAQAFPSKPVRVIVPFAPGSVLDVVSRLVAPHMGSALGQPVVVENRPGAGGRLGAEQVARLPADGHALLFTSSGSHVGGAFLVKNLPYDAQKDFTPVTAAVSPVDCLIVHPSLPVKSVSEFLEYARRNPDKLAYGSNGIGSTFHMVGELIKQVAGIDMLHVPFHGAPEQTNAIITGQIQVAFNSLGVSRAQAAARKVKLLAVLREERYAGMPQIPTLKEGLPAYQPLPNWFGYFGPGAMSQPVVQRLGAEIVKGLNVPDNVAKINEAGLVIIGNTPEQFATLLRTSFDAFGKAVKAANLQPQ